MPGTSIRRASQADAAAIAAVHVATWRSAYPGLLPDSYLAALSEPRLTQFYRRLLADRGGNAAVFVAVARPESGEGAGQVVGFSGCGRARRSLVGGALAEGEIDTLYVLDDFRERGLGRRLLRAASAHLAAVGCGSAMLWVLRDNPSRWFYQRLGGRAVGWEMTRVGGRAVAQMALVWDPIALLLDATAPVDGA
ncbi:GNAT family N-acetyltransferase [Pseudoroseomonas cervicalis]|uniref:GNAT family N-acetyltransferase n=1 Tax=Teichococcus cervicalis TaxID=204525 RepID=UPI0022F18E47|nr:GNAT family N-acetyltransferase [Pseudoroseomonas cervicalis]WBV44535.1 GNAT family N-acetyltransferase [Pseudoroseomonas cervicalis]